jgi:hypothetical protein
MAVRGRVPGVPFQGGHARNSASRKHFIALRRFLVGLSHASSLPSRRRLIKDASLLATVVSPASKTEEQSQRDECNACKGSNHDAGNGSAADGSATVIIFVVVARRRRSGWSSGRWRKRNGSCDSRNFNVLALFTSIGFIAAAIS